MASMKAEQMAAMMSAAGDAEQATMAAIEAAKADQIDRSRKLLKHADAKLKQAHQAQTQMLTYEARGQKVDVTLLMVHSQDHLISAMTIRRLADDIIDLYQQVHAQK
ncbi:PTS mannose transporter subunit IIA [Lactobacillus sp. HMSC061B07]|nr:PTS lactose/cellobiose transporter subunit IIA [Lacticaseibacillus rhamnosus]OFR77662.1 PTS mannose transporter subunit IIA [Lactobacillus sp. HMSC061B07]